MNNDTEVSPLKKKLIGAIIRCMQANRVYISGEIFFSLAFMTEEGLIGMAHELHINPTKL